MRFERKTIDIGGEDIPMLVASTDGLPKAVFMSYESFLEMAATLYTAIETLKAAGVDPALLDDEDESEPRPLLRVV